MQILYTSRCSLLDWRKIFSSSNRLQICIEGVKGRNNKKIKGGEEKCKERNKNFTQWKWTAPPFMF